MMQGRSKETHKALIKALFRQMEAEIGLSAINTEITLKEPPAHYWAVWHDRV